MDNNVELVFILDRSGSMSGTESDIIGGFNSMIAKYGVTDAKTYVSTILFSDDATILHDRLLISEVPPMTAEDYYVNGCTALLDALGSTVERIRTIHRYAREEDRPVKTVVVVMTDGYENASRRYNNEQVKKLVNAQKEEGWEFIFVGADIDAFAAASSVGIDTDRAVKFSTAKNSYTNSFIATGEILETARLLAPEERMDDDQWMSIFHIFTRDKDQS